MADSLQEFFEKLPDRADASKTVGPDAITLTSSPTTSEIT